MERDLTRVGGARYDLLVVGGGIHGLFVAYDAASRGLSVALIEQSDFGSGLSFNHQRTIHGGLRALESGRFSKAREQIAERRTWAVIAPRLVMPLPFVVGTYRWTKRSRSLIGPAFHAYNAIGYGRNKGLPESLHLPSSRLISPSAVLELFPEVGRSGLTGGAVWHDYQVRHPDRLNELVARAARGAGAELINYATAVGPSMVNGKLTGAHVRDELTGAELEIRARAIVLAAGAGISGLLESFGGVAAPPLVRAMNVLVDRPGPPTARAAPGQTGRMLTAVPWRNLTLVGTYQSPAPVSPKDGKTSAAELAAMLVEVNAAFPFMKIGRSDIRFLHQGLTPAVIRGRRAELMPVSQVLRAGWPKREGLFAVIGVKYTTARQTAEIAVDSVCEWLGTRASQPVTAATTLPHAGLLNAVDRAHPAERELARDIDAVHRVIDWYGTEAAAVFTLATSLGMTHRLANDVPVLAGEVAYAVRAGHAWRLSDIVFRRTPLGSAGHPGRAALEHAAVIMGNLLKWSPERREHELREVEERFRLPE